MSYDCWTNYYTILYADELNKMLPEKYFILQKTLLIVQIDWDEVALYYSDLDEYEYNYQNDEIEDREKNLDALVVLIKDIITALELIWLEEPDGTSDLMGGAYWTIKDAMILNPKLSLLTKKFGSIPVQLSHMVCG